MDGAGRRQVERRGTTTDTTAFLINCGRCRSGCTTAKVIIAEKGYLSRQPAATIHQHHSVLLPGPNRQEEPGHGPHRAPTRQYIQSIF
jgi:hypothetical protein